MGRVGSRSSGGHRFLWTVQLGGRVGNMRTSEFWHTESRNRQWLRICHKSSWVDGQLAALDMPMGRRGLMCNRSLQDYRDPSKGAEYRSGVMDETMRQLCEQGRLDEAVEALGVLVQTCCCVSQPLFYVVLKESGAQRDLFLGRRVHALMATKGYESDTFLCNHILRMYASHASLHEAMDVFRLMVEPDAFTWSAIISAHVKCKHDKEAVQLYHEMRRAGVKPDGHVFVAALQACAKGADLQSGQKVHADVLASGVEPHLFVWNALVDMYAKCGSLEDAQTVFDGLGRKDVVTWNAMIAGYSQQGMVQEALRLFNFMEVEGMAAPNSVTLVCLLQVCATVGSQALAKGKQLHAQIGERRVEVDVYIGCSLVNMYAKCGSLEDAKVVFAGLGKKNVATWNAMIAGYSQQGMGQEALCLYKVMQEECTVAPDSVTFVCLLQVCANMGVLALEKGRELHAQIREQGLQADVSIANSLVNMYAKCGSLDDAQRVFDSLGHRGVVMWTALIAGYSQKGMGQEALRLYSAMQEEGVAVPDAVTFVSLLQACATVGAPALEKGKELHAQIEEQQLYVDDVIGCSLVNMYSKCGSLEDAQNVFDGLAHKNVATWTTLIAGYAKCGSLEDAQRMFHGLPRKDLVVWNAMIAGYSQQGMGQEALKLHGAMQQEGTAAADSVTFGCLLQACASLGSPALEMGKQIHAQITERGLQADEFLGSSLVNMYANCGSLEDAQGVFDGFCEKNVVMWSAMIAGYSQQGMGHEALHLYRAMQKEGIVVPNCVTFVCLLQACADVAALHLGRQLHVQIEEKGLHNDITVACSLINMYGKCGSMANAQEVFEALPERDKVTWNALIAGYSRQGESEAVFGLFDKMREVGIQPASITFLSVLTVCSHAGLVSRGQEYFEAMTKYYSITPTVEHYTCLVDLLGRAGMLDEALDVVRTMTVPPDAAVWQTLLGACQKWSNVEVGCHAFDEAVKLDGKDASAYVLMSNIYSGAQMWEQAQLMQARRTGMGAWKQPGQSWWTDMEGQVHSFLVRDGKHSGTWERGTAFLQS